MWTDDLEERECAVVFHGFTSGNDCVRICTLFMWTCSRKPDVHVLISSNILTIPQSRPNDISLCTWTDAGSYGLFEISDET